MNVFIFHSYANSVSQAALMKGFSGDKANLGELITGSEKKGSSLYWAGGAHQVGPWDFCVIIRMWKSGKPPGR